MDIPSTRILDPGPFTRRCLFPYPFWSLSRCFSHTWSNFSVVVPPVVHWFPWPMGSYLWGMRTDISLPSPIPNITPDLAPPTLFVFCSFLMPWYYDSCLSRRVSLSYYLFSSTLFFASFLNVSCSFGTLRSDICVVYIHSLASFFFRVFVVKLSCGFIFWLFFFFPTLFVCLLVLLFDTHKSFSLLGCCVDHLTIPLRRLAYRCLLISLLSLSVSQLNYMFLFLLRHKSISTPPPTLPSDSDYIIGSSCDRFSLISHSLFSVCQFKDSL